MSPGPISLCILVVDDEPDLVDNIALALEAEGYRVLQAADGEQALEVLRQDKVDLVLADIAMPRLNGYQLYERVRANPAWLAIPFVFLTARRLDSDIRYGKELGVDDYLTKPISAADLLAVVRGKLRRAQQLALKIGAPVDPAVGTLSAIQSDSLTFGPITMNPELHRVWLNDANVELSAREFMLLECLIREAGRLCSPEELILATHGLQLDSKEAGSLLRPLIRSLRRKLGHGVGDLGCIENVRGLGYRLAFPEP